MAPPQHTITLQPDTTGRGVPAIDLITLYVNKGHAVCPLYGQQVAVPKAVADELRRTAATPQARQARYAFAIHHPKGRCRDDAEGREADHRSRPH